MPGVDGFIECWYSQDRQAGYMQAGYRQAGRQAGRQLFTTIILHAGRLTMNVTTYDYSQVDLVDGFFEY